VDICHVPGLGQGDVPLCTRAGGGAIGGCAEAVGEAEEAAEGGLKCGGNARVDCVHMRVTKCSNNSQQPVAPIKRTSSNRCRTCLII
jgi:hypothetical protein